MPLLSIIADVTGLTGEIRESNVLLRRIAEALERVSPPLPSRDLPGHPPADPDAPPPAHSFAESPLEYESRTSREAALAQSLGFAGWSPDFQKLLWEERERLMQPSRYRNEEGEWVETPERTESEAEACLREAVGIAKSAYNTR
jgi:hypothetical protein